MLTRIEHIGIVVRNVEEALKFYEEALGLECTHVEEVAEQAVRIACLPVGQSEIELVQPTTEDSGVARFLEKRGEGVHHLCFEVDDIEATLADLRDRGLRLIDEKPRLGRQGQKCAFIHPRSTHGVLIELYERAG